MRALVLMAGALALGVGCSGASSPPAEVVPQVVVATPTAVSTATVAPLVAPTIVPVPLARAGGSDLETQGGGRVNPGVATAAPQATATAAPRATATPMTDVRAQIETAMQAVAPNASAEVITDAGTLVAKYHATQPRTAASTIKLPLLVEVLREGDLGKVDLSRRVTIRPQDVVGGTGDLQYQVGRTLTLREVVEHMVLRSDNVGANILVDIVGMDGVNATSHANDFPDTFFRRHMLDTAAEAAGVENMTTAADLADMFESIVRGTLISASVSQQALQLLDERGRIDKSWLGLKLPRGARLSHINGTLTGVRNDVGLITSSSGKSFVLAVCQDHLTSEASGEAAIADLARRVLDILDAG